MNPSAEAASLLAAIVGVWMFGLGYLLGKAHVQRPRSDRMSFED